MKCFARLFAGSLLLYAVTVLCATPALANWELYEQTNVKGKISGTIKKGSIIKMESGSVYEVTDLTLQLVLELAPEALVLKDGAEFKLSIKGFEEPLLCKQLVAPATLRLSPATVATGAAESTRHSESTSPARPRSRGKDIPFDTLIPPDQQRLMGIQKLTAEEKERLRVYIVSLYLQGFEQGKASGVAVTPTAAVRSTSSVIESKIDGDFEGWEGETIVKLANGQIWQQAAYHYEYHYAFMPDVLIYRSGGEYKMKVDGTDEAVVVTQLK